MFRLFDSGYPPIPWPYGSWPVEDERAIAATGDRWYARAAWRECSANTWSRWRWLATVKAIRKVIIFRLFFRFVRDDEVYPRWYLFLRGDW